MDETGDASLSTTDSPLSDSCKIWLYPPPKNVPMALSDSVRYAAAMNPARISADLDSPSFRFLAGVSAEAAGAREGKLLTENVDVAELEYLISRHRVSSNVLEKIAKSYLSIDQSSREEFLASARRATIHAMALATETCRLSTALSAAGVRHLVIKGPALAQRLYGDMAARSSKDIDILVDPAMFSVAEIVIVEHRYKFNAGYRAHLLPYYPRNTVPKDASYYHDFTGIQIELHHSLFAIPALLPLDFERLWANRDSITLGNVQLPILATSDEFIYMCIHGATHYWFRLKWLQDIARLLAVTTPDLFDEIADSADRLGVKQMVLSAVALANEIFGLNHTPAVLRMGASDRVARDIIHHSRLALAKREVAWQTFAEKLHDAYLRSKLRSEWSYKRAVLANIMVSPADVELLRLPTQAKGLYCVVRPFLLMQRRLWRLLVRRS